MCQKFPKWVYQSHKKYNWQLKVSDYPFPTIDPGGKCFKIYNICYLIYDWGKWIGHYMPDLLLALYFYFCWGTGFGQKKRSKRDEFFQMVSCLVRTAHVVLTAYSLFEALSLITWLCLSFHFWYCWCVGGTIKNCSL